MKRFLIKFLVFIIPLVIIFLFWEYKLSKTPNNYSQKKYNLEKKANEVKVLVLGGSHTFYGINPKYISQDCYNAAFVSQTLYYDIRITDMYLDRMSNLKLVIIPIDLPCLEEQLHGGPEEWRDYYYYHFWGIKYKDLPLFDIRRYSFIATYSINRAVEEIKSNFKPLSSPCDENGFTFIDSSDNIKNISDSLGMQRAIFVRKYLDTGVEKYVINDLDNFVNLLKHKNIEVVLLTSPVFHTYSDYLGKKDLTVDNIEIHDLCDKYHLKYFDYFTDNRFNIHDFEDNDHLNYLGAEKWSKIIDSEIVKPFFK